MSIVMSNVGEMVPLVTEQMCVKEKAYLDSPELWDELIPLYLGKYAKVCGKL
jgi:hypothetical protein